MKFEKSLFFLTILLLPTQLGKHFWTSFASIFSLRIDYLSPTIYLWDLLAIILFGFWIVRRPKTNRYALGLLLYYWLTQVISLIGASNLGAGLVRFEQLVVVGLWGLYIASQNFSKLYPILVKALISSVVIESVIAIFQVILSHSLGLWVLGERSFSIDTPSIATFNWFGQVFLRPYGTFPHPNVLAAFLILANLLLIGYFKRATLGTFILAGLAILLSFSRTAILFFSFQLIFLLRKQLRWLLLIGLLLAPFLIVRFESAFNFDSLSLTRRVELVGAAWQMFLTNPMFGVGLNNFIVQIANSTIVSGPSRFLQPVHNVIFLSLAETGLLGLIGLLVLVILPVKRLLRVGWRENRIMLLMWGAIAFLGMFDHYFLTLPQGIRLFFLTWGLSIAATNKE